MGANSNNSKLPFNIRILIGLCSLPSLFLASMIGVTAMNGDYQDIDYFEWVYSLVGIVAMYIALTGKRLF